MPDTPTPSLSEVQGRLRDVAKLLRESDVI